jgi:agmatine/peptidylarginine deiminase
MFMYVVSPDVILMGSYDPADDPTNAAILDTNAARLESQGYTVIRAPQPKHYCIQCQVVSGFIRCPFPGGQGNARECGNPALDRRYPIWATYLNITRVGNAVLVPVYREVPESLRALIMDQEAEALSLIQQAHDLAFGKGTTEVIPVVADQIIPGYGAIHCVTENY